MPWPTIRVEAAEETEVAAGAVAEIVVVAETVVVEETVAAGGTVAAEEIADAVAAEAISMEAEEEAVVAEATLRVKAEEEAALPFLVSRTGEATMAIEVVAVDVAATMASEVVAVDVAASAARSTSLQVKGWSIGLFTPEASGRV